MLRRLWQFCFGKVPAHASAAVSAVEMSVIVTGNNTDSPIQIGATDKQMARLAAGLEAVARSKGVAEAPLRAVLKKLGEKRVPFADIPARLEAAAGELISLRAELARPRNDRPEFAAIRAKASKLIDAGEFENARAVLRGGRQEARALRQEISRSEAEFLADEARLDKIGLNIDAAIAKFTEAAGLDPANCWLWFELGDLWQTRGSLGKAAQAYLAGEAAARISGNDRDLSVSHSKLGDVRIKQGDLPGGLASFSAGLVIAERLAKSDPGNTDWQRDLSVSHDRIGDVRIKHGDLPGGLASFSAGLVIAERLAKSDPGNTGWQRDLSVSHNKLGDVRIKQGDLPGGLASFSAGLVIAERLAKSDPGNTGWQRDLSVSLGNVGMTLARQNNRALALKKFEEGRNIVLRLRKHSPTDVTLPKDMAWFEAQIAALGPA